MSTLEKSLLKITKSPYLMVYGFESCKYQEVISELMQSSQVRFVFDYHLGNKGDDQVLKYHPQSHKLIQAGEGRRKIPVKRLL